MGIYFSISSIIFLFIFIIIFFSKDNTKNIETKIYSILLIITFVGTLLDIIGYALYKTGINPSNIIYTSIAKGMLVYFILWAGMFFEYAYEVADKKIFKMPKKKFLLTITTLAILVIVLPIKFNQINNTIIPAGLSVSFTYIVISISLILSVIFAFKNLKNIKKYTPIFLITVMLIISMIIQNILPQLFLINYCLTIVIVVMYHTIENPDLKLIEELKKNRNLTSKSYIEKSNFLFRMSAELRKPINNIKEINDINIESNNINEIKENSREIDNNIRNANFTINNVLDVTSLDSKKIKITNDKFNLIKLLNEIKIRESKKVKNIRFDFKISDNLPEYLYGDSIKIKQVLTTLIDESIKKTKNGFIEINIDSINKYDVCRLIISIEDSSTPLSLNEINTILNMDYEIEEFDLNKVNIDMRIINKLISMMNGSLMIKSNEGNEILIVLDNVIGNFKKEEIINEMDILLISNNEKLLKYLENILKEYTVNSVMNGIDAFDLIRSGEHYNLIIVDDEMQPISGLDTLKKLKENEIDIPCIVMLEKGKERFKKHYIKDGFIDYILKEDIDNEINRIKKIL